MSARLLFSTFLFFGAFTLSVFSANAASVTWVGGTGDWETGANWSGGAQPTADDDVTIDASVTVSVNATTTVNSLIVGSSTGGTSAILNFDYNAITAGALILDAGDLTVYPNAMVTHTAGTASVLGTIYFDVQTGNAVIHPNGAINVSTKGYLQGEGPGEGTNAANPPSGAGYGGYGGSGTSVAGGITYGSITAPVDLGSGGGVISSSAGDGGGAIRMNVVGAFTMNGSLNANGEDGNPAAGAASRTGGSGGSIYLDVGTLAGTGTITSNGGASNASGGGGGGGRIALYYTTDSSSLATLSAYGGAMESASNSNFGGAGTIYKKADAASNGDLIIDNNFQDAAQDDRFMGKTPLTGTFTFETLTVKSRGHMVLHADSAISYSTLTWSSSGTIEDNSAGTFALVTGGGSLTVPATSRLYAHTARTFTTGTVTGALTHGTSNTTADYRINLTFSSLTIEPEGSIAANGKGHYRGEGPGAGTDTALTPGGAGYGGYGGSGSSVAGGITYGSITAPIDPGSGGGLVSSGSAGDGGGAVQLTVSGTMTINGSVNTNGGDGDSGAGASSRSGGSGGSVYLNVGTLAGTGSITANGGASNASGGAGGGGRISLLYTTDSSSLATLSAYGGAMESADNPNFGGAGTIYKKASAAELGELIIDNNFQDALQEDRYMGKTPLTGSFNFENLTIRSRAHVVLYFETGISYSNLDWSSSGTIEDNNAEAFALITDGGSLSVPVSSRYYAHTARTFTNGTIAGSVTHAGNGAAVDYRINLTFSSLTIEPNGSIDVSGKGHPQGEGPGQGTDTTGAPGGAGHGGFGASGTVAGGVTYGSITTPVDAGSGGGEISSSAGDGGGIVQLAVSGTMAINGSLDADGIDGDSGAGAASRAGGSGGSVYLNVGTLAGTGSITSSGGASNASGGAGGGGRIALLYTTDSSAFATLGAYGGAMESASLPNFGGAGTIYKKAAAATNGDLIIDNNFLDALQDDSWIGKTPLTGTFTFDTLTVKSRGHMVLKSDSAITYSTLNWSSSGTIEDNAAGTFALITGGGALSVPTTARYVANTSRTFSSATIDGTLMHSKNTYTEDFKLYLVTTGNFTLNAGGAINLDDLGFVTASGTGAGADAGTYGSGAGHGGTGGVTADGSSTGGAAYDSETGPVHLGSGGGNSTSTVDGGDGGGAVYLSVGGSMTLNGEVSANGQSTSTNAGGGSGGSIWFAITGNLSGTGNINARGGSGGSANPGAGAGGRIAITCTGHSWTGTGDVTAGTIGKTADTGTVYTTLCPGLSNTAPTVTGVSAVQSTNGSGDVVIVFTIDDADDDNTVQAKLEYNTGGGAADPTISTTGSETSATYGDPGVDNSATYQVGTSAAYILTSSGANTVSTVWESATDAPSANTTASITITPYDGTTAGSSSTTTLSLDNVAPTISGLTYNSSSTASSETIAGTTEASATVYSNSTYVTTADGSGNFSFSRNLGSGVNSFVIYTIDAKGNVSNSTVATITTPGSGSSGSSVPSGESMAGEDEETEEEPAEEEEEVEDDEEGGDPVEEEEDSGEETPEEETDGDEGSSSGGSEEPVEESDDEEDEEEEEDDDKISIIDAIFGGKNTQSNVVIISEAQQIKPKKPSKITIKLFLSGHFGGLNKDGIPKALIRRYFGNIKNFKADRDTDGDEATDGQELVYGSNPLVGDTDGDSISDGEELVEGTYPFTWDSDNDGISDKNDANPNLYQYNPVSQEEMDDYIKKYGIVLGDGETLGTIDSDEDGLSDLQELELDTDPQVEDSDGDSYLDGEEVLNYATDPNTASRPTGIALANAGVNQLVEDGNQFLIGRSEENSEVFAYAVDAEGGTQLLGETVTDEEGKFAVYTNGLAAGTYDLVVVQTDGKREIEDISYPLTFVVSADDLLEEPVMKRLGEKLVMNNTTILATWESVLLGAENDTKLVDSGIQLMVGQSSDPNSSVELRAVLADGTDQFLGQANSDQSGKYTLLAQVPVEGDYAIYAYTRNEAGEIVDTSFPLLLNVKKDDDYLVSKDGVIQLDYTDALRLESIAVDETTTINITWTSLVLSNTLVTDSSGQAFDTETPRALDAGRHAVTVYAVDRESGERSQPVRIEFDVLRAGIVAPAASNKGASPWLIFAIAGATLMGILGYAKYRKKS